MSGAWNGRIFLITTHICLTAAIRSFYLLVFIGNILQLAMFAKSPCVTKIPGFNKPNLRHSWSSYIRCDNTTRHHSYIGYEIVSLSIEQYHVRSPLKLEFQYFKRYGGKASHCLVNRVDGSNVCWHGQEEWCYHPHNQLCLYTKQTVPCNRYDYTRSCDLVSGQFGIIPWHVDMSFSIT